MILDLSYQEIIGWHSVGKHLNIISTSVSLLLVSSDAVLIET